jgi:hypothetical protein
VLCASGFSQGEVFSLVTYDLKLTEFVKVGARLIAANPVERYGPHAANSQALEPGFIPLAAEPLLTFISFFPNASTLAAGYIVMGERFIRWGETAKLDDYEAAYEDWLAFLPSWPYYRRWMHQIVSELDIDLRSIAWLPLVKLPRPSDTPPDADMIRIDRDVLREQLESLRPRTMLIQSQQVDENAGGLIREITPNFVVQKQSKVRTSLTSPETPQIIKDLKRFVK